MLAAEGKAEKLCDQPVWIHGVDHRTEMQTLGARDLSRSASAAARGAEGASRWRGCRTRGDVDVVELLAATPAEELILCEALGLDPHAAKPVDQPLGRRAVRPPDHEHGPDPPGRGVPAALGPRRRPDRRRRPARHRARRAGSLPAAELVWVLGTERRWT